jgi:hypothetical protein
VSREVKDAGNSHSSICHNSRRILLSWAVPDSGCQQPVNMGDQVQSHAAHTGKILRFSAVSIMSLVLGTRSFVHH